LKNSEEFLQRGRKNYTLKNIGRKTAKIE